ILASGSGDDTIRLWDGRTGDAIRSLDAGVGEISSLAFTPPGPDGARIVVSSFRGVIQVRDLAGGAVVATLPGHRDAVQAGASGDGGGLGSTSAGGSVRVWGTAPGESPMVLRGHDGPVMGAAITRDGSLGASASLDGTVRLWDCLRCQEVRVLRVQGARAHAAVFAGDGKWVLSTWEDGRIRAWETATGR